MGEAGLHAWVRPVVGVVGSEAPREGASELLHSPHGQPRKGLFFQLYLSIDILFNLPDGSNKCN